MSRSAHSKQAKSNCLSRASYTVISFIFEQINHSQIYLIISTFCCVDIVILVIWFFKDPMYRRMRHFPLKDTHLLDNDVKLLPMLEHCEASMIWYGALFGYKGLVLLFGLFLAYETRSVKMKQLNDARLVGMSIYNVVVCWPFASAPSPLTTIRPRFCVSSRAQCPWSSMIKSILISLSFHWQ